MNIKFFYSVIAKCTIVAIMSTFFVSSVVIAQLPPEETVVIFSPDSEKDEKKSIKLSFYEVNYGNNAWDSDGREKLIKVDPDAGFLLNAIELNTSDDMDKVLSLWGGKDREEIKALLKSDPDIFQKNLNFYKHIKYTRLVRKIFYGKHLIFLVQHNAKQGQFKSFIKTYVVLKEAENKYYFSNALFQDPFFLYLSNIVVNEEKIIKKK